MVPGLHNVDRHGGSCGDQSTDHTGTEMTQNIVSKISCRETELIQNRMHMDPLLTDLFISTYLQNRTQILQQGWYHKTVTDKIKDVNVRTRVQKSLFGLGVWGKLCCVHYDGSGHGGYTALNPKQTHVTLQYSQFHNTCTEHTQHVHKQYCKQV